MNRLDPRAPAEYLVGHLEDALARDPRVAEQGLRVKLSDPPLTVEVTGTVVAPEVQAAVTVVIGELLPGAAVRDRTTVADYPEVDDVEEVR